MSTCSRKSNEMDEDVSRLAFGAVDGRLPPRHQHGATNEIPRQVDNIFVSQSSPLCWEVLDEMVERGAAGFFLSNPPPALENPYGRPYPRLVLPQPLFPRLGFPCHVFLPQSAGLCHPSWRGPRVGAQDRRSASGIGEAEENSVILGIPLRRGLSCSAIEHCLEVRLEVA